MNETILFYAFRYALGRRTHAVSDVVDAVCKAWPEIGTNTRSLIVKEISEAISQCRAGMDIDVEEWSKVLALSVV